MISKEFIEYIDEMIVSYNEVISQIIKYYLQSKNYNINIFSDEKIFQDLLLLNFITNEIKVDNSTKAVLSLEQIILIYFQEEKDFRVTVFSDKYGLIYLSQIGYIKTQKANQKFILDFQLRGGTIKKYHLTIDNIKISSSLLHSIFLNRSKIELFQSQAPYSDSFFRGVNNVNENDFQKIILSHKSKIDHSFEEIEKVLPFFFNWFIKAIHKIQIYDIPSVISFASINILGIPFISASSSRSEVFYLEDLIHQGAHNIFYFVTYIQRDKLFKVPSDTPVSFFNKSQDNRHLYGVFHGLFTQTNINTCFDLCLTFKSFENKLEHELKGRLSDNMKRWKKSIDFFDSYPILTEEGNYFFNEFKNVYNKIYSKRNVLINEFDTSNQPYIFDYYLFNKLNPYLN